MLIKGRKKRLYHVMLYSTLCACSTLPTPWSKVRLERPILC